ncbi:MULTISPECIES: hypothetical protein [unclassified Sphingomonas]|uniref:hypothetical protein n=1 Tax=unclassified Sphingomonas TaxID=196159 RepID=UPI0009680FD6|nr:MULTISPECIES: hypothetical protein [unclassified Sphingomonas]MBN8811127.1 hypothetical protein [Sphingomonas sp.]OJY54601.1 MAG: hypothetical protein BGP17_06160 [Sphingomonas sp. 67-41]
MADDTQPTVVHSVQSAGSLQLVVQVAPASAIPAAQVRAADIAMDALAGDAAPATPPATVPALDTAPVAITDLFGTPAEVVRVHALDPDTGLLHIQAIPPPADPAADAPAYRLTIGDVSTWFAPESKANVATPSRPVQAPPGQAAINYLGRDYAAFTSLMRSRVSQIVRDDSAWALDHPADPMTTLIEALAYAGDHLSFRQDAAGTESYLPTARHRLSLRRHARLRDYGVNDGCNARTALVFTVKSNGVIPAGLQVVTQQPGIVTMNLPATQDLTASTTVFETMADLPVSLLRNNLAYPLARSAAYTLPQGAIQAQLNTAQTGLVPGQLVAFVQTAAPAGAAQPFGAQVVRLIKVELLPNGNNPPYATMITWHPEDALTKPLTVAVQNQAGMVQLYGNVGLADHGRTIAVTPMPDTAPAGRVYRPIIEVEDPVSAAPMPASVAAFDGSQDIAEAALLVPSAKASLAPDPGQANLCVKMLGERPGMAKVVDLWTARQDLMSTPPAGRAFAAAPEDGYGGNRRHLFLRFGDGALGEAPAPGTTFTATVRVGDGQSGRVRANALVQIVGSTPMISWVSNPLPATPAQPELNESVRLFATTSFRTNLRGIDPDDWERLAQSDPLVTEADARLVNGYAPCIVGIATTTTPDGYTYPIAKARLMEYAVLGAPPTIQQESDVPINVSLVVYCSQGSNIGAARERLLRRIGAGAKTDGGPAHFHPTAWPLGRPVILADLIALLGADPVVSLVVSDPAMDPRVVFQTVSGRDNTVDNIKAGRIAIGSNERARAGNDGFHPELGIVRLFVAAAK